MVPPEFANFFIAGASAGAALVGLLFVAVSIAPERMVTRRAPIERQAVAGSAFTALINAFLLSLAALIPASTLAQSSCLLASCAWRRACSKPGNS